MIRSILLVLALCLASTLSHVRAEEGAGLRVLFIGNSLTYYNGVPELVSQISRMEARSKYIEVEMLAAAGATIAQHLATDRLRRHLAEGNFSYVVFQEMGGWPICPPEFPGCSESVESIETLSELASNANAEPIWYSTYQRIPTLQEALSKEARQIAGRLGIRLADVGAAWTYYESVAGQDAPFKEDGHPNEIGSLIAAAVIFQAIAGQANISDLTLQELCFRKWQGSGLQKASLASGQQLPEQRCKSIDPKTYKHVLDAANKGFNRTPESSGPAKPGEFGGGAG